MRRPSSPPLFAPRFLPTLGAPPRADPHARAPPCSKSLDGLLESVWAELALVKIYTKKRGAPPDLSDPICMRRGSTIEVRCPSPSPPLGARKGRRRRRRALTAPSLVLLLLARLPNPTSCPPLAITPPSLASPRPVPRPASPAARVPRRPPLHRLALPVRARLGRVLALQPDAPEGRAHARRPGRGRVRPPSSPRLPLSSRLSSALLLARPHADPPAPRPTRPSSSVSIFTK